MSIIKNRRLILIVIILLIVQAVSGCNRILGSDSGRARDLLETLIKEPENKIKIVEITQNKLWSDEDLLPNIRGANFLKYLRARTKQNQFLEYRVSSTTKLVNKRSYIDVSVAETTPGVLRKINFRHVFRVFFKEDINGNNIITGCEILN